ncbi:hypothetical protein, partial [Thiolapillus sp.]
MGAKYGAATSLRSCCVVLGDQDGWGTNRLSKAESILGTGMSQNLSRGRRHACGDSLFVARDNRRTSSEYASSLIAGALASGCNVVDLEVAPMPLLSFA